MYSLSISDAKNLDLLQSQYRPSQQGKAMRIESSVFPVKQLIYVP